MKQPSERINISIPKKPTKIILIVLLIITVLYLIYQCIFGVSYFFRYDVFATPNSIDGSSVEVSQQDVDSLTSMLSTNSIKHKTSKPGQVKVNGKEVVGILVLERQLDKLESLNLSYDDQIWSTRFRGDFPVFRWWY